MCLWSDPFGQTGNGLDSGNHETKGGGFWLDPGFHRVAGRGVIPDEAKGAGIGFRLVRTLGADEEW